MVGQLEGKSAIITGASRGVGLAIARRFFDAGANVVLADADEETIQKEALALDEAKERAISFRCDPTMRLDLNNLMAAAVDAFDDVDVLVHTASVVAAGEAFELEESEFQRAFDVNVKSSFLLTQMVAKHMIQRAKENDQKSANCAIINVFPH